MNCETCASMEPSIEKRRFISCVDSDAEVFSYWTAGSPVHEGPTPKDRGLLISPRAHSPYKHTHIHTHTHTHTHTHITHTYIRTYSTQIKKKTHQTSLTYSLTKQQTQIYTQTHTHAGLLTLGKVLDLVPAGQHGRAETRAPPGHHGLIG